MRKHIYDAGDLGDTMGEKPSTLTVKLQEFASAAPVTTRVTTTIEYATKSDRDLAL